MQYEIGRNQLRFMGHRTLLQIVERDRCEIGAALQGLAAVRQWIFDHRRELSFTPADDNSVETFNRTKEFVSDLLEDFVEEFGSLQVGLIRHTEREKLYTVPFVQPFSN